MKKIFRMMLLLTMMTAACVSVSSCSSDDNKEPEYVPVESAFSKLLKEKPVHHLSYSQNYGKGYFALYSDPMMGNYKTDYYVVCFSVYNAPADDMYDGSYEVEQADGSLWGWKGQWQPEYKKNELSTWDNNQPVKGAWAEIKTLDKGDEYGKKKFKVTLHVDEMTEENGDYARDINISFTGRDTVPMLVN